MVALRFSSSILHINKLWMINQNKREGKGRQDSVDSISISGTSGYDFIFVDVVLPLPLM